MTKKTRERKQPRPILYGLSENIVTAEIEIIEKEVGKLKYQVIQNRRYIKTIHHGP
jgi:hypothetical protein